MVPNSSGAQLCQGPNLRGANLPWPNLPRTLEQDQDDDDDDDQGDLFKEEEAKDGKSCSEAKPDCRLVLRVVVFGVLVPSYPSQL